MNKTIIDYIDENLNGDAKQTALDLVNFLKSKQLTFYKDMCDCWKDKIYYWVKFKDECVDEEIKTIAWKNIDLCGNCGSCGGGQSKKVFGKTFDRVCGCTFRIDNPTAKDIPFLEKMVEIKVNEIRNKGNHYDL